MDDIEFQFSSAEINMSIQIVQNKLAKPQDPLPFMEIPGVEYPESQKADSDEVLDFSSSLQDFNNLECKVVGVTSESPLAITRWMEKEAETGGFGRVIRFPILSDKDLAFSSSMGVARNCGMPAKSCLIIDPQGRIRYSVIQQAGIKRSIPELVRLVTVT